jgi:hypothetical protein
MTKRSVFLSHRHDDDEWTEAFARALELQDVEVWLDDRVAPGEKWADLLRRRLATSDAILALVSGSNESSAWQLWEIGAAVGMGKRIITIVPEGVEGSGLPLPLRKVRSLKRGAPAATAAIVAAAIAKEPEPHRIDP